MALSDVNFSSGDGQDFLVEVPSAVHAGTLGDILTEESGTQQPITEVEAGQAAGGNIFIISE